jgi:hypothetical protein
VGSEKVYFLFNSHKEKNASEPPATPCNSDKKPAYTVTISIYKYEVLNAEFLLKAQGLP